MRFIRAAVFGVSSILALATAAAGATEKGIQLRPGGSVEVNVPGGIARSVEISFDSLIDRRSSVSALQLEAISNNQIVGTKTLAVNAPGGKVLQRFAQPFDKIRVLDKKGTVRALISNVTFCERSSTSATKCTQAVGAAAVAAPGGGATSAVGKPGNANTGAAGGTNGGTGGNVGPSVPQAPVTGATPAPGSGRFHGERTPISRMTTVKVQAGPYAHGSYLPTQPWIDQAKLAHMWSYRRRGDEVIRKIDIQLNEFGMPLFPAGHRPGTGTYMSAGGIWMGTRHQGAVDVAGTWEVQHAANVKLNLWTRDMEIVSETPTATRVSCALNASCAIMIQIEEAPAGARAPTLVQITDGNGRAVSDKRDLANGLITRERWRKALYGYGELRMMVGSSATDISSSVIRYDEFPNMDFAIWGENAPKLDFKRREGLANLKNTKGLRKAFVPVEARLRAAYEIGAVYHHNFPHLFLEHRGDIDPALIGEWAVALWADQSVPMEKKLALFNDYELQHVDAFGADMMANQQYIVNNQVKVEVSNETWNYAFPWNIQATYFERKAQAVADKMGRPDLPEAMKSHIQTGYDLTKTVARLRKMFPAIEWRGVMAVHTARSGTARNPKNPAPETPSGYRNLSLHSLMTGYELFWQDYEANRGEWSQLYAAKPARPGDWFEVQGTTYFFLSAELPDGKTHLGGIPPEELQRRVANRRQWPALRAELLDFFVNGDADRGAVTDPRGKVAGISSLAIARRHFRALSEHAAVYGMQVGSYEGGSHANPGTYYKDRLDEFPELALFWRDFADSVEMGLIQASVHDAAVAEGWMTLSDYDLFNAETDYHIFGTRRSFEHLSGRYCEYARWMPVQPTRPLGLAANTPTPRAECGRLLTYLDQARANRYYVGQTIPTLTSLLE